MVSSPCLVPFRREPTGQCVLVCLPHAGGGAAAFQPWQAHSDVLDLAGVRLPGREGRMTGRRACTVGEVLDELVPALAALGDRRYALFGHSLGSLLGFEAARELRARGGPEPEALFVSGCRAPHQLPGDRVLHDLPLPELVDWLAGVDGLPPELDEYPELLDVMAPTICSDLEIVDTYRYQPGPPLDSPIRAFAGTEDRDVPPASSRRGPRTRRPRSGWTPCPATTSSSMATSGASSPRSKRSSASARPRSRTPSRGVDMPDRTAAAPARLGWRVAGDLSVPDVRDLLRGHVPVTVVDLTYMTEPAAEVAAVAVNEAARVAETGMAPRLAVVRLGAADHVLLITVHRPVTVEAGRTFVTNLLTGDAPSPITTEPGEPTTRERRSDTVTVDVDVDAIEQWRPLPDALLAGMFLLLARYGDDRDLAIAGPSAVVRLDWSDTGTTADLVDRVRAADRSPDGPCDARFVFIDDRDPTRVAGRTITPFPVDTATDELVVTAIRHADGLRVRVNHDQRLAERLTALWTALPHEPDLAGITATTTAEQHALLTAWHGPVDPYASGCLHELIELHAMLRPDRPAVVAGDRRLTYRELDDWANQAAHVLREHAVGPESVVAVVAERTVESVVGMLAVLKAGGCYVPVDPHYPAERLHYFLSDSGSRVLLGASPSLAVLPPLDPRVAVVDLCSDAVRSAEPTAVPPLARPDNLAYVIYTSGSTGAPKAVAVSHRSIVCSTHARRVGGAGPTVDLVTMPLSFDGSAGGLYWALTTGGTALLPTEREVHDPHLLAALVADWRVTHIHSVPSTYSVLLEAADAAGLADLALVSVGGEPLPPGLVARHLDLCPDAKLLNDYGPTEGTVWAIAHTCRPDDAAAASCRSGDRCPTTARTCSTMACAAHRPACPASCISAVPVWRAATWADPA